MQRDFGLRYCHTQTSRGTAVNISLVIVTFPGIRVYYFLIQLDIALQKFRWRGEGVIEEDRFSRGPILRVVKGSGHRIERIKSLAPAPWTAIGGRWLTVLLPREAAVLRLFCFPYAGAGAAMFRLWPARLPEYVELCAVQLPGRGERIHEPALSSLPELVAATTDAVAERCDLPFVFFGHSMGAVLASEVARNLKARELPQPVHLIVSGRRPPHMPDLAPPMHELRDAEFVAEINRRYRGIHPEILNNPDILALFLPTLRADITALETYRPNAGPTLDCPITAFGGAQDSLVPRNHLEAWADQSDGPFRVRMFPGGHFYMDSQRDALLADLSATLAPMLQGARQRAVIA